MDITITSAPVRKSRNAVTFSPEDISKVVAAVDKLKRGQVARLGIAKPNENKARGVGRQVITAIEATGDARRFRCSVLVDGENFYPAIGLHPDQTPA